ncbi:MAG: hypothetical protein E7330_03210 [Clostridiales bacterium]|nr:hypothetical protein [Clostridiales bacterium]
MAPNKRQYDDDDGRTIVDMNVEGMPWYQASQRRKEELEAKIARGDALTTRQTVRYTWYALLAGLAVLCFIGGGLVLFILLLCLVW